MPRLDVRLETAQVLSYTERLLLDLLITELNRLRAALDMPPLTPEEVREQVRRYLHDHPRGG